MTDSPESISVLLRRLAAAVRREYGVTPIDIEIHAEGSGRPLSLPIPRSVFAEGRELTPTDDETVQPITSTERRILKAVAALEAENPTGEEIAAAARMPYQPHLRKTLYSMRSKGMLGGFKGDVGYPITPLGLSLIELEN